MNVENRHKLIITQSLLALRDLDNISQKAVTELTNRLIRELDDHKLAKRLRHKDAQKAHEESKTESNPQPEKVFPGVNLK